MATTNPVDEAVRLLNDILYVLTAMRVEARNANQNAQKSPPKSTPAPTPPQPPAPPKGLTLGTTKDAADAGTVVMGKVLSALGPITSFAQLMNSAASGLQIFSAATQVLAATLAPVLLPVVLSAAGALLDLSEDLQGRLLPGLREWNRLVFGTLVPVLGELVNMFNAVVNALEAFFTLLLQAPENFKRLWSSITGGGGATDSEKASNASTVLASRRAGATDDQIMKAALGQGVSRKVIQEAINTATNATAIKESRAAGATDDAIRKHAKKSGLSDDMIAKAFATADAERARAEREKKPYFGGGEARDGAEKVSGASSEDKGEAARGRRGLDDAITSFRLSIGSKANFTSLASVGQQAQLAGLGGDPIQKRMLDAMLRTAEGVEGARADARGAKGAGPAPLPARGKPGEID